MADNQKKRGKEMETNQYEKMFEKEQTQENEGVNQTEKSDELKNKALSFTGKLKNLIMQDNKISPHKIFAIIGIIVGVVAMIVGYDLYDTAAYHLSNNITFGADFYTEIYSTTEAIRGDLTSTYTALKQGIGALMMMFGAIDICAFGCVLTKNMNQAK